MKLFLALSHGVLIIMIFFVVRFCFLKKNSIGVENSEKLKLCMVKISNNLQLSLMLWNKNITFWSLMIKNCSYELWYSFHDIISRS